MKVNWLEVEAVVKCPRSGKWESIDECGACKQHFWLLEEKGGKKYVMCLHGIKEREAEEG